MHFASSCCWYLASLCCCIVCPCGLVERWLWLLALIFNLLASNCAVYHQLHLLIALSRSFRSVPIINSMSRSFRSVQICSSALTCSALLSSFAQLSSVCADASHHVHLLSLTSTISFTAFSIPQLGIELDCWPTQFHSAHHRPCDSTATSRSCLSLKHERRRYQTTFRRLAR